MNLIVRLLKTLLLYLCSPGRRPILGESKVSFRVWPNDLDTNFHMNNGRYLTLMDLGRLDLLLHLGAVRIVFKKKWFPVLAGLEVRFRRPLNLFQKFEIHTRIVTWDTKWIFIEQKIKRAGELALHAYLKGVFVGPKGSVPITELLELMGVRDAPPPMPPALALWVEAEDRMIREERPLNGTRAGE